MSDMYFKSFVSWCMWASVHVSPGLGQQNGIFVGRGGFWKVVEDSQPVLQEFFSMIREQNIQSLNIALLQINKHEKMSAVVPTFLFLFKKKLKMQRISFFKVMNAARIRHHENKLKKMRLSCYPGIVSCRQNNILTPELLEELCIIFLFSCMRPTKYLLEKKGGWSREK